MIAEQDILRLEVGVNQVKVVQDYVFVSTSACDTQNTTKTLTSHACQQLTGKCQDLAVGEGHKVVVLQKVKHTLPKQIHDNADVATEIEAVPEMNAAISVLLIVCLQGCKYPELDLTGIAVFLHRANDLDGDKLIAFPVLGLYDLAESALTKQLEYFICNNC